MFRNKTFKNPAKDDDDDLLLKNYNRTYGRPKKSSSPQLSPRSSKIKKDYWKKQSALINSSLKESFDNAAEDDDDEIDEKLFKKSHGNSSRVQVIKFVVYNKLIAKNLTPSLFENNNY